MAEELTTDAVQDQDPVATDAPAEDQAGSHPVLEGQDFGEQDTVVPEDGTEPQPSEDQPSTPSTEEPSAEESPAEPTPEPEPEPETQGIFNAVEAAKELGLEQVEDPNQAAAAFLYGYQQTQAQLAKAQAELERQRAILEAQQQGSPVQQPPAAEPEAETKERWWNPPKFNPEWIERYRVVTPGEDGQPKVDWSPDTPDEVRKNTEAYQRYLEQWADDLVRRPQEVLPKVIRQEVESILDERFKTREMQQDISQFQQEIQRANGAWMYEHDPITGQIVNDPVTGQPELTSDGRDMIECLRYVERSGVANPRDAWKLAVAMFDAQRSSQPQFEPPQSVQPSAAPGEGRDQLRSETVRRRQATDQSPSAPSRSDRGAVRSRSEESGVQPDSTLSPGRQLLEQLRHDGVI